MPLEWRRRAWPEWPHTAALAAASIASALDGHDSLCRYSQLKEELGMNSVRIHAVRLRLAIGLVLTVFVAASPMGYASRQASSSRPILKVLFIGNSYTYFNNLGDIVSGIAAEDRDGPTIVPALATRVAPPLNGISRMDQQFSNSKPAAGTMSCSRNRACSAAASLMARRLSERPWSFMLQCANGCAGYGPRARHRSCT